VKHEQANKPNSAKPALALQFHLGGHVRGLADSERKLRRMNPTEDELRRFAEQMREQTSKRQQMRAALKTIVTPALRKNGFTGTWPDFRRLGKDRYDLLTFQFDKYGDGFVIDLGQCPSGWVPGGRIIPPPDKLTVWDLEHYQRARVQPGPFLSLQERAKVEASLLRAVTPDPSLNATARWFRYENAESPDDFKHIAESVVPFVEKAVAMFEDFQHVQKIDKAC
jgi:hypothetical protein